mgnify:CR=1 FL=1
MKEKVKTVQYRRKQEGRTNYKKRLNLLKSGIPRLVVRKSLKHINAQIVKYYPEGDKVIASVNSKALEKFGWRGKGNIPGSYLTGLLLGKKAKQDKNIKKAILDIGMLSPVKGSKVYAVLKGATDAGIEMPYSEEVVPSDDAIQGKNIEGYARKLKDSNPERFKKQFSGYLKNNFDPTMIQKNFNEVKDKIIGK